MSSTDSLLDVDGPAAPPRLNGELVFDAPWQRRIFGVTMAMTTSVFSYEDFRRQLIAQVAYQPQRPYWESWAAALEDTLVHACVVDRTTVEDRHSQFLARPHGHDH